jgi:hypothetical protein
VKSGPEDGEGAPIAVVSTDHVALAEIVARTRSDAVARRLAIIPGIGAKNRAEVGGAHLDQNMWRIP